MDILETISNCADKIVKITLSGTSCDIKKVTIRPVKIRNNTAWQIEKTIGTQVFHENVGFEDVLKFNFDDYKQILIQTVGMDYQFIKNKTGYKCRRMDNQLSSVDLGHDKGKHYILNQDEDIPVLRDLGIFNKNNQLIKAMSDKYKQIEKFVEIIDEAFTDSKLDEITILDFGCGKSYLTFIVYYYFVIVRKIRAKIIGYDLKRDVVEECNRLAQKYHYDGLKFEVSDVTKDELYNGKIDMAISLHACDIATDYALNFAINSGAKYIFSVPCCQHEVNLSIKKGGDYDILLKDGLIKERFSALLTDAIRVEILRALGYSVDVIEFVDFSHTPKNIMLRAKLNSKKKDIKHVEELMKKYGFSQKLFELTKC